MNDLSRAHYLVLAVLCLLLGLPVLAGMVTGRIGPGGDPYVPLLLTGLPLGGLLLAFGLDRLPRRSLSDHAVRLGWFALFQFACLLGADLIVRAGRLGFQTAYAFFAMAGSFLALLSTVLLIRAAVRRG